MEEILTSTEEKKVCKMHQDVAQQTEQIPNLEDLINEQARALSVRSLAEYDVLPLHFRLLASKENIHLDYYKSYLGYDTFQACSKMAKKQADKRGKLDQKLWLLLNNRGVRCPSCCQPFECKKELLNHIVEIHSKPKAKVYSGKPMMKGQQAICPLGC